MRVWVAIIIVLSLFFNRIGFAQSTPWSPLNTGMYGGNVTSLFSFGEFLFAGTYNNGIYVSADNGSTWKSANNGLPKFSNILSFASDGINLYAGSYYSGLYVSSDSGASWKNLPQVNNQNQINALQFVGSNLYCATVNGISVTTDKGNTFKSVSTGLPTGLGMGSSINCLAAKETNLFAGAFFKGIYRSKDNGATWTQLTNGFPTDSNVSSIIVSGKSVIAGTNSGVYISFDDGDSWLNFTYGLPNDFLNSLAVYNNKIYVGTFAHGLFYSDNNGSTWQSANIGTNNFESVNALHVKGSSIYAGTSQSGVITSNDGGINWTSINKHLTNEEIKGMVKKEGSIFAVTPTCKVYESKDHGTSWAVVNKQLSPNPFRSLRVKGDSLLASTDGSGVYFSIDNGINWTPMNYNLGEFSLQVFDLLIYQNEIIVGNTAGVYHFQSESNSWEPLGTGLPSNSRVFKLFEKNDIIYAGTHSSGLFRSKDQGVTWLPVPLASSAFTVNTIAPSGKYIVVPSNGRMFLSKDNGDTWQTNSANIVNNEIVASAAVDSSYVFFGGYDGVFMSTNHGLTMSTSNIGLPAIAWVFSLLVDDDRLLAGTSEGIWSIPISAFAPIITSFTPAFGAPGTLVTIKGINFDHLPSYNFVKFNGVIAKVISASPTSLVIEVPSVASKGTISVSVVGRIATTVSDFCVSPQKPSITADGLTTETPMLTSSSFVGNQWFHNNIIIEGATKQTLSVSKDGFYTVQVTNENGCSSLPSEVLSIIITDIENIHDPGSDISIYPVPTKDQIIINLDRFGPNQDIHIQIVNSLGQEIDTDETTTSTNFSVDVSDYINGVYFVRARQGKMFFTKKFIKM